MAVSKFRLNTKRAKEGEIYIVLLMHLFQESH